jgi:hypothetical protein
MSRLKTQRTLFVALACTLPALLFHDRVRANAPAGHYVVNGGGTVLDTKTKLTWQQTPSSSTLNSANANTYCTDAGTGWRLPTVKELQTLVDDSVASPGPTIDAGFFPGTPAGLFWSSTSTFGSWLVDFSTGNSSGYENIDSGFRQNVRCVK